MGSCSFIILEFHGQALHGIPEAILQVTCCQRYGLAPDPEFLHHDSPMRAYLRLHTACLNSMNISSTPGSAETRSQMGRQLAFQLALAIVPSGVRLNWQLSVFPSKSLAAVFPCVVYAAPKSPKVPPSALPLPNS